MNILGDEDDEEAWLVAETLASVGVEASLGSKPSVIFTMLESHPYIEMTLTDLASEGAISRLFDLLCGGFKTRSMDDTFWTILFTIFSE